MTGISMSGNLPAADGNGLVAVIDELTHDPKRIHVAVVLLDAKRIVTDADSGDTFPVARIRRIEVIREPDDREVCERLMRRALDQRSGREGLPYDLEQEVSAAFENVSAMYEDEDEDEAEDED